MKLEKSSGKFLDRAWSPSKKTRKDQVTRTSHGKRVKLPSPTNVSPSFVSCCVMALFNVYFSGVQ